MKISELIKRLQEIVEQDGDLDTWAYCKYGDMFDLSSRHVKVDFKNPYSTDSNERVVKIG